ncbi:MAG: oligoendopeptidase F [Cellvibrionaceae bacterium]
MNIKTTIRLVFILALAIFGNIAFCQNLTTEDKKTEKYVWDLTDLFATLDDWEEAYTISNERIKKLPNLKNTLGKNAKTMASSLTEISNSYKEAGRIYVYTSLMRDEDQRNAEAQTRYGKARQLLSDWDESTSWVNPEIISVGEKKINRFLKREPRLEKFTFMLKNILRDMPYTLDQKTEEILAQAGLVLSSAGEIYENYANADIPWPTITLSDGSEVQLTQAGYSRVRSTKNREDRKKIFNTFWSTWQQYNDGMGATLAAEVQSNVFKAKSRGYTDVLSKNLFSDGLPAEIYTQLVTQVNNALPVFHRYLTLRGKILGVNDLSYFDIYPPLIEVDTGEFSLTRSKNITMEALAPFGETYLDLLAEGLSQNWMHSHPQPGKRSGAYMSGFAYDVHPYVLLNHNDDYNGLSTFAHEWGHAVHSLLANKNNPWETADYSTFIAEMASTINEILLEEHMIANAKTNDEKLFYLGQALESIRGTLFRQTMFAEFELAIHQSAEKGEPLTGPALSKIYGDLLKRYHGHDKGVMTIDELYSIEWAYIPHFYREFYVFQYATSISGAAWFAEQFLAGDEKVRDAFIRVLSAGGSDYPHNILLNEAGLDMTKESAYEPVMRRMNSLMDRIEALL